MLDRRKLLKAGLSAPALLPVLLPDAARATTLDELVLHGPPAGPSITLAHAVARGALSDIARKVSFRAWRNPDEMRAGITSGTMGLVVMPTVVAANLYNRGIGLRLVNVMTNGLLHVVAGDASLTSFAALKGKRIALPFRNDTPDTVFNRIARFHGVDATKDMQLEASATPIEAIQLLLAGRIDAALVPEPAASAAIVRGKMSGKTVVRVIDVQAEWQKLAGKDAHLPQAGLAATAPFLEKHAGLLPRVQAILESVTKEVNEAPARAAGSAASALELPFPILEMSIPFSNLVAIPARAARKSLEDMFRMQADVDMNLIGGKLPDEGLYL